MDTNTIKVFIEEIDEQLALLDKTTFSAHFEPLVCLRNRILLKYKPPAEEGWEIKNKHVLKMLTQSNWNVNWVYC